MQIRERFSFENEILNNSLPTLLIENFQLKGALCAFLFSMLGQWWILYVFLKKMHIAEIWVYLSFWVLLLNLSIWLLLSAGTHFIAEIKGHKGNVKDLCILLGFSFFPCILLVPLGTVFAFLPNIVAFPLFFIFKWVISLLILLLAGRAIKYVYKVSYLHSFLYLLFLPITLFIIGSLLFLLLGLGTFNAFF